MKKKFVLFLLLLLVLPVIVLPVQAETTGKIGKISYKVYDDHVVITDCEKDISGAVVIPDTIEGLPVTEIGMSAFRWCEKMTSVELPKSIQKIGPEAFAYAGLVSIDIPASVTSIGEGAFFSETLTQIVFRHDASSPVEVDSWAFDWSYESVERVYVYVPDPSNVHPGLAANNLENPVFYPLDRMPVRTGTISPVEYEITVGGEAVIVDCEYNVEGVVEIPETIEGCPVVAIKPEAFASCWEITQLIMPDTVEEFGEGAFYGCDRLRQINIPAGITEIPDYAFSNCYDLFEVDLPEGITSIGNYAFSNCCNFLEVDLPEGIISIGNSAFASCTSLSDMVIPVGVTSIGKNAFFNCTSLTSVVIPESVVQIGECAFEYCVALQSVNIPNGITEIPQGAFRGCTQLTNVGIPETVTKIAKNAFLECTSLQTVTLPNGLKELGESAFGKCSALTTITIPASVTNLVKNPFTECASLKEIKVAAGNTAYISDNGVLLTADKSTIVAYPEGKTGTVTIPSYVSRIGNSAFYGFGNLVRIDIPETVNFIEKYAFEDTSLRVIVFDHAYNSSLEIEPYSFSFVNQQICVYVPDMNQVNPAIANYAWQPGVLVFEIGSDPEMPDNLNVDLVDNEIHIIGCNQETQGELVIPDTIMGYPVTKIGSGAFSQCYNLTSVVIPNSVTSIGGSAFSECSNLTSVELPDQLKVIGAYAFHDCGNLEILTFPDSLESIGDCAFLNCSALKNVVLPGSMKELGVQAFVGCSALQSVTIKDGASTRIGDEAFKNCQSLTEVYLGEGVSSIGSAPFWGCTKLKKIAIPGTVGTIAEYLFTDLTALESVILGVGIERIEEGAFSWCESLKSIKLPDGLTYIGDYAFSSSGLEGRLVIPDTVKTIGQDAFSCVFISSVEIPQSVTEIGYRAFDGVDTLNDISFGHGSSGTLTIGDECFTAYTSGELSTVVRVKNSGSIHKSIKNYDWSADNRSVTYDHAHTYTLTEVIKQATCTTYGQEEYTCTICDATYVDEIGALGHTWDLKAAVGATCIQSGLTEGKSCSACGEVAFEQTVIPARGHAYIEEISVPTCTKGGYTIHTCRACGDTYTDNETEALGHDMGEWGVTTEAKCTEPGEKQRKCSRCDRIETEVIAASGHEYESVITHPTCTEAGYTTHTCKACGDTYTDNETEALAHDYQDGVCSTCGEAYDPVMASGDCGNGVTWVLTKDGIITFSGKGPIPGYTITPWNSYRKYITKAVIETGITAIGQETFNACFYLEEVVIPDTVEYLELQAFCWCEKLEVIRFPGSIARIGQSAFAYSSALKEIYFSGDAPKNIFENAFTKVTATIYYPADNATWTSVINKNYGGTLTWVAYGGEEPEEELEITVNSAVASVTAPDGGWKEGSNTFYVSGDSACVVAVSSDGGNTYIRLKATTTGTANTYQFTADDVTSETIIEVQALGDVNGDGGFTNADVTMIRAVYAGKRTVDALCELASDVNGDGSFTNADVTMMRAAYAGKIKLTW